MQVDRARNCFLDLHGKFSLSLSEILKKVVRLHPGAARAGLVGRRKKEGPEGPSKEQKKVVRSLDHKLCGDIF